METESGAEFISEMHVRHVMRYVKASELLKTPSGIVLDVACGTGYGSGILARKHAVVGMDNDDLALAEANQNYPNIRFLKDDLLGLKTEELFNAVVSIETIEHFNQHQVDVYLGSIKKLMALWGQFILSTPYCIKSGRSPITKQHLWEFSLTDLENTLYNNGFLVKGIYPERHIGKAGRLGYCMVDCVAR